ncbi:MAG: hypothetical protein GF317_10750 [Candidatus Lokiarchaeota archaeon]|nr:hypothetical protein [Candidatus Lokiarchaeota archaeon]MBD3200140.1 hypothetical protein [Candidatus Lokiarchaeota archaeon]
MIKKKQKTLLFLSFISLLLLFSIIIQNTQYSRANVNPSANLNNIVLDGVIEADEWVNPDINKSFYLDVDNNPDGEGDINVDGNNTIYIGQDNQNVYIALDLWGDRSNTSIGEWVGVWFNFNNRTFDTYYDWYNYLGKGTESLVYNVEDDDIWEFYRSTIGTETEAPKSDDIYTIINGYSESNYGQFYSLSGADFNITSESIDSTYKYRIDFSFKIPDLFVLPNWEDVVTGLSIRMQSYSNITIDNNMVAIWNGNNFPNLANSNQIQEINTGTTSTWNYIDYGLGNMTTDNEIQFSILGNNSANFKYFIHRLRFEATVNDTNNAGGIRYPYTSLINQNVKWSFGASPENATAHRMFEIRIDKSEFNHYDLSKGIGMIIGGYGTLSFPGNNYWVLSENQNFFTIEDSETYIFIDLAWIIDSAEIPGYDIYLIISILGVISTVFYWKYKKLNN